MNLNRLPDSVTVDCEGENTDVSVRFQLRDGEYDLLVRADRSLPTFLRLRWKEPIPVSSMVLGDAWERSYADIGWRTLRDACACPWYFLLQLQDSTVGFGVKTQPNSFVSFSVDEAGVTALVDVRSGSFGVHLHGRELNAATFLFRDYCGISAFEAGRQFCKALCDAPLSPKEPVYGGNNWYYAYGHSSREEILSDAKLQSELAGDNPNRPYMVIDDCWQLHSCCGPWEPNAAFGDMKTLAAEFRELGVKPGIWVRFLHTKAAVPDSWRFENQPDGYLDPSVPAVLRFIAEDIRKIKAWGYTLIKHDFSTYDIFGLWGFRMGETVTGEKQVRFHDNTRTGAEIVLALYRTIRTAAGEDTLIIGCNTLSHLSAGLVELMRIGDDTSGKEWARTRDYGINTLAFRLMQHRAFYDADADCVGILGQNIPWQQNRQWLELLAQSGTPLFVSCPAGVLSKEAQMDLKEAYRLAAEGKQREEPLDWFDTKIPARWKTEDGEKVFCWD